MVPYVNTDINIYTSTGGTPERHLWMIAEKNLCITAGTEETEVSSFQAVEAFLSS